MSDPDNFIEEKPFAVEIAKQGRAFCKKCKQKCMQGQLRVAKLIPNPSGAGKMKTWHHLSCIFEMFLKQRQTTRRIESSKDIEGWDLLSREDQKSISKKIRECNKAFEAKSTVKSPTRKHKSSVPKARLAQTIAEDSLSVSSDSGVIKDDNHKDNSFREFRTTLVKVSKANNPEEKIRILKEVFNKGTDGTGFKGDKAIWCKLLLPAVIKRTFNLQTKQISKIFSKIFQVNQDSIMSHLEEGNGDIGQSIQHFFDQSRKFKPAKQSTLTIFEVDEFLDTLTQLTKEDDQFNSLKVFAKRCTSNDLKIVVRLIKHDLRMHAGAKHVFQALHPNAYEIFQSCRNIETVVDKCFSKPHIVPPPKPKYFDNVKLLLEDGVSERHSEHVKSFLDNGGTIVEFTQHEEATHILHLKDTISEPTIQCANSARHVIVEWIKDTILKESLQDIRPYTVRWKPY